MRLTTTPGNATLAYLEAGDTCQDNDIYETEVATFVCQRTFGGFLLEGHRLSADFVRAYKPRRYTPAE